MDVHSWWYQQPTDHYFVPRDLCRHQLHSDGVPLRDLTASGIPIMPQFRDTLGAIQKLDRASRRQRLLAQMDTWLDPSLFEGDASGEFRPLIIQMSTGRSALEVYVNLLRITSPIALVIVCGRQADIR